MLCTLLPAARMAMSVIVGIDNNDDDLISISDISGSEASELTEPDELSGALYERFVRKARNATKQCVAISWYHYHSHDVGAAWEACVKLAYLPYLRKWYVGGTKFPLKRMVQGDPQDLTYTRTSAGAIIACTCLRHRCGLVCWKRNGLRA